MVVGIVVVGLGPMQTVVAVEVLLLRTERLVVQQAALKDLWVVKGEGALLREIDRR